MVMVILLGAPSGCVRKSIVAFHDEREWIAISIDLMKLVRDEVGLRLLCLQTPVAKGRLV